ncbi:putative methyltransferase [Bacteriovorax sp. BSW11_IV]|uniref:class I SAM-dependent methyltransferase n=1 Tax=Bacteriovorax sp. BSW11_IV TaxID=1353529 RepID=UPI00038A10B7|nr:methyltransferase domain-containing protein [Bacteriovorax sp. BSW11_IV]EQC46439.1 putative methyltransferase [Bacteriovorax sp. BSW11_IV]
MKLKSHHDFDYTLRELTVDFPSEKENLSLNFHIIDNLDDAIDRLCEALDKKSVETGTQLDPLSEDYCPYFGLVWPSAKGLVQYLLKNKEKFAGKTVLEIGCGLALPSIVLSSFGAKVLATDFHRDVPLFLERNLQLNKAHVDFLQVNWRKEKAELPKFDFVIGSDILYEGQHPLDVPKALCHYLKDDGEIILADPGRSFLPKFLAAMKELSMVETSSIENVTLDGETRDISIHSFVHG